MIHTIEIAPSIVAKELAKYLDKNKYLYFYASAGEECSPYFHREDMFELIKKFFKDYE